MPQFAVRLMPQTALGLLAILWAAGLMFVVALDQGQLASLVQAAAGDSTVHELFHDARHMLGFPCH